MKTFSKSKILAFRQCPKRLWLELTHPEYRLDTTSTTASFKVGHEIGEIAQNIYDPDGMGATIDIDTEGFEAAFARTQLLLKTSQPIFEAGFRAAGALAFADILLPVEANGQTAWRMVEVKSSTSVKNYHRDDAAIQSYIAKKAQIPLTGISLAHINSAWIYQGDEDYHGLLNEEDLTQEAFSRSDEVKGWIESCQNIVAQASEPAIKTGGQCSTPFACGFIEYCKSKEPKAKIPIDWLPRLGSNKQLLQRINDEAIIEIKDAPDELLNEKQLRVKNVSLTNETYFDQKNALTALAEHKLPAYFMDFETINLSIPIWKGTRPYQQIPFQFSVHKLNSLDDLRHSEFLEFSGNDPSETFAKRLIEAVGDMGSIFVYNAGFETARINELSIRFPELAQALLAINLRVVDLLPIARENYYHASQQGSWSIKKVLPALCPDLKYDDLVGVQDGGMAMEAFKEAISTQTPAARKTEIQSQLLDYCALDTYAMVRMWSIFSGQSLKV